MIGPHVSINTKTFYQDLRGYREEGFPVVQVFLGNTRKAFNSGLSDLIDSAKYNYLPMPVICHASFPVSLCRDADDPLYGTTMRHLVYLSHVCNNIGIRCIVTHIGGVSLGSTVRQGIENIKSFCMDWLEKTAKHDTVLCLETDSGSSTGRCIGTATVLYKVVKDLDHPRIRICFDTEHVYASGYDLQDGGLNDTLLDYAGVIHLNTIPQYVELGSHLDRHSKDLLRESKNLDSLKSIYDKSIKRDIPMILERNREYYLEDLEFIREEW